MQGDFLKPIPKRWEKFSGCVKFDGFRCRSFGTLFLNSDRVPLIISLKKRAVQGLGLIKKIWHSICIKYGQGGIKPINALETSAKE